MSFELTWLLRGLAIWAVGALAFLVLARVLPGVGLAGWEDAFVTAVVVGLLNAVLRPVMLRVAASLGLIAFGIIVFFLDAAIIEFAAVLLPGFSVDSILTALVLSFGVAAITDGLTGLLSIDDDEVMKRNIVKRIARRRVPPTGLERAGTIVIQIDGLAEPILRREVEAGRLPTFERWLRSGSHRLIRYDTGLPSMTSSAQAGILHGNNTDIPAFRWYDKNLQRLLVSNHPRDAQLIIERQTTGHGLLREGGSSLGNIFDGDSERCIMTMACMTNAEGKYAVEARDFEGYLAVPYNLTRGILGMVTEIVREYWEAWQQRRRDIRPRMHRGGVFPLLRAATCVVMRDATIWLIVDDMFSGRLVSYSDFLGYDEVAHHAGPESEDALRVLRRFDEQLRLLEGAAREAPRHYQFVVLSDHGQSAGATFLQRYGITLEQLIQRLIGGEETVRMTSGQGEGWAHLNAVLTEMVRTEGATGEGARRLLRRRQGESYVDLGPEQADVERAAGAEVVVCASGNLAQVYFAKHPGRLSLEYMVAEYPGLIEGLVQHEGIGFILVYSEVLGPVVLGLAGARRLDPDCIERGGDPLASFPAATASHLLRLSTFSNVGDIMVNSMLDPATNEVAAFEELIGSHGGAGGLQTQPFILFPSEWTDDDPEITNSEGVYAFLNQHIFSQTATVEFQLGPKQTSIPSE